MILSGLRSKHRQQEWLRQEALLEEAKVLASLHLTAKQAALSDPPVSPPFDKNNQARYSFWPFCLIL